MPTPETVQQIWTITLVIYFVVVIVVAALLTTVLMTSKKIHGGVSAIWTVGQQVANNTIHIPLMNRTNYIAGQILEAAKGVVGATAAVKAHAERCPGCPACVLGRGGAR